MKNESAVHQRFKGHFPQAMMLRRIEDKSGALGTWDTYIGFDSRGAWIELKHTSTANRKPKLRKGQRAFGADLIKAWVPGCYVVGDSDGGVRVLGREYDGENWKECLLYQRDTLDKVAVQWILDHLGFAVRW